MKKQLQSLARFGFKSFISNTIPLFLYASPVGPPSAPSLLDQGFFISDTQWTNIRAGYIQDFLVQQKLASRQAKSPAMQGFSSLGTVTWNIRERLDLQFFSGSGQLKWNFIQEASFLSGLSPSSWIWGGGAKLILFEVKDTTLSVSGSGGYWQRMRSSFSSNGIPNPSSTQIDFRYWQLSCGLTQKIDRFYPYCGVAIQRSLFQVHLKPTSVRLHEEHQLGPFLGCTLTNGIEYLLNLEWRGWFEQGVAASCEVRF